MTVEQCGKPSTFKEDSQASATLRINPTGYIMNMKRNERSWLVTQLIFSIQTHSSQETCEMTCRKVLHKTYFEI